VFKQGIRILNFWTSTQFEDDDEKSRMSKMDLSYCF
jgi:hypothetical protein